MKLTYAAKDARDFDKALKGQKSAYYVDVETRVLTDREVTRSSIMDGLAWLKTMAANANDVSVVFYRVLGEPPWQRFNGGAEGTRWYYGALADVFSQTMPGRLSDRLSRAVTAFSI